MKTSLHISEKFYSIQGEGVTMGIPAVFVRLSGCNLLCQSSSWICDSIEVWRKGTRTEFQDVLPKEYVEALEKGAHIVFTGGEPMLHMKAIEHYLAWFVQYYGFKPFVEVETNGTITPSETMVENVDQWNVSPKLASSGETYEKRFKIPALTTFNVLENVMFKFVISNENDLIEVIQEYGAHVDLAKAVLMPAGETQKALEKTRQMVAEQCIKLNMRYSDRLHVVIWNEKTGV